MAENDAKGATRKHDVVQIQRRELLDLLDRVEDTLHEVQDLKRAVRGRS
jgi:hypothetical protein